MENKNKGAGIIIAPLNLVKSEGYTSVIDGKKFHKDSHILELSDKDMEMSDEKLGETLRRMIKFMYSKV